MTKNHEDRVIRVGRYVGQQTEGTPAPWHGNLRTGVGGEVIREAARILNQETLAPPQQQPRSQ